MESAHHFSSNPDCNNTAEVPSLIIRTALSIIPFVSVRRGLDVWCFQDNSSHALPNCTEIFGVMTSGFSDSFKNFVELLFVSIKFFILHGHAAIHPSTCQILDHECMCVTVA